MLDNPPLFMMDTMCTFGFALLWQRHFCHIGLSALLKLGSGLHIGEEDLGTRLHHKYFACSFVHVHTYYQQLSVPPPPPPKKCRDLVLPSLKVVLRSSGQLLPVQAEIPVLLGPVTPETRKLSEVCI